MADWARAFKAEDWETVESIQNPGVKEARKTMEFILSNPTERDLIWHRKLAQWDEKDRLEGALMQGREEGRIEGGAEGRAEGRAEGIAQGEEKHAKEVYDRLLAINMPEAQARRIVFGE